MLTMTKERAKIAPKPDHSHLRPVDGGKSRAIETPKVTSSSNPNRLLWVAQITAIRDTPLWHKAHMFDPSKASVSTWIFTIARNRRIDFLRKQRRPEPEELTWGPEPEPEQADALALQQETEQLGAALAALPQKQQDLIRKAYFGDLSHSEIAEQTGLPLGTIKSRIRLALERLRHSMK